MCFFSFLRVFFFSDYVNSLKKLLFTLQETLARYTVKAPEPLNRQFPVRASKEEALKAYKARKQLKTVLLPSSKFNFMCCST